MTLSGLGALFVMIHTKCVRGCVSWIRSRETTRVARFPTGSCSPIEVHELGVAYFVADGHHRIAHARARAMEYIDAEVTRLQTNYTVGPGVDVRQLVHTEQHRILLEESGLARARAGVVIEFSRPGGYPEALDVVKAYGYDLARQRATVSSDEEMAVDFYDNVYQPGVAGARREALTEICSYKTDADLFLCPSTDGAMSRVTIVLLVDQQGRGLSLAP